MEPNMQKYSLTKEQVYDLVDKSSYGVVSTIGEDGYPYGAPVNIVRIGDDFYFHGRKRGEKVFNIARDPRVCLTVVEDGGFENFGPDACNTTAAYRSAVIRGRAVEVTDEGKKSEMLHALIERIVPERSEDPMNEKMVAATIVFKIAPENITGKYHEPSPGNRIMR